jgi:uncharacterized integral membrane protein
MHFLKTLFWVLLAVVLVLFGTRNWHDVTLNLWGDIQADIKIPLLLLVTFLLGLVPTWLVMRARMWAMRRRLEVADRVAAVPVQSPTIVNDGEPVI